MMSCCKSDDFAGSIFDDAKHSVRCQWFVVCPAVTIILVMFPDDCCVTFVKLMQIVMARLIVEWFYSVLFAGNECSAIPWANKYVLVAWGVTVIQNVDCDCRHVHVLLCFYCEGDILLWISCHESCKWNIWYEANVRIVVASGICNWLRCNSYRRHVEMKSICWYSKMTLGMLSAAKIHGAVFAWWLLRSTTCHIQSDVWYVRLIVGRLAKVLPCFPKLVLKFWVLSPWGSGRRCDPNH